MEIMKGNSIFPGIAIGRIVYYSRGEYEIRQYMVSNVTKELEEYENAKKKTEERLQILYDKADRAMDASAVSYAEKLQLLGEKQFNAAIESMINNQKVSAVYALKTLRDEMSTTFVSLSDSFIKDRIRNIREVSDMLMQALGQNSYRVEFGEHPIILVSENLSPTEVMEMDKEKLLAVVTHIGSSISHTAIMAKTINIPALFDVKVDEDWDGRLAVVDGYTGTIYLDPVEEILKEYEIRRAEEVSTKEELLKLKEMEDVTADGKTIPIYANIGSLDDLAGAEYYGAAGIGMLRSEFQYLGQETYPRENDLFREYKKLAESIGDKAAVIRTVDLGGDKKSDYMNIPKEDNPMMGNRGIRLCLDRRMMFRAQLRAIYRASAYGNLEIMFPMITDEKEVEEINKLTHDIWNGLDKKRIPYRKIRRGIMIETPAAVMIADTLASKVDFLSLGTNDLIQYTLAMDRQNPYLKDKYNEHHPAIMKMIKMTIDGGHKENKPVYLCGELAAEPAYTDRFIKMGIDGFSVVPACILPVRRELRKANSDTSLLE